MDRDQNEYASSPCMSHEFEGDGGGEGANLQILYVRIEESSTGFRWQVCAHGSSDLIELSRHVYPNEDDALRAGRIALDKVCDQFRRYRPVG